MEMKMKMVRMYRSHSHFISTWTSHIILHFVLCIKYALINTDKESRAKMQNKNVEQAGNIYNYC